MDGTNNSIRSRAEDMLRGLPSGVELAAAAKSRTPEEVLEAVDAGIRIIGQNYLQEAAVVKPVLPEGVRLHFIGHLQKNKVKKAVEICDLIETVDSFDIAVEIDKRSRNAGKVMPVLIEINSGREQTKFGVSPEEAESLLKKTAELENIKVLGLMTMGPLSEDQEKVRSAFRETRHLFEKFVQGPFGSAEMKYLSMGMSDSYLTAIEEGANIVRIGTALFGPRKYR